MLTIRDQYRSDDLLGFLGRDLRGAVQAVDDKGKVVVSAERKYRQGGFWENGSGPWIAKYQSGRQVELGDMSRDQVKAVLRTIGVV